MRNFILDFFSPPSIEEQKERYIKKYGYPKRTVIFVSDNGAFGSLMGSEDLKEFLEK